MFDNQLLMRLEILTLKALFWLNGVLINCSGYRCCDDIG